MIAFGRGGVCDSIVPEETGVFFHEQSVDALVDAVERFERWHPDFSPQAARANARRFAPDVFDSRFTAAISEGLDSLGLMPTPFGPAPVMLPT